MTTTTAALAGQHGIGLSTARLYEKAQALGISKEAASKTLQALYSNGMISYPYNASTDMPAWVADGIPDVLAAISHFVPSLLVPVDFAVNPAFFNSAFASPHHAIVPWRCNSLQGRAFSGIGGQTEAFSGIDVHAEAIYTIIAQAYLDCLRPA